MAMFLFKFCVEKLQRVDVDMFYKKKVICNECIFFVFFFSMTFSADIRLENLSFQEFKQ